MRDRITTQTVRNATIPHNADGELRKCYLRPLKKKCGRNLPQNVKKMSDGEINDKYSSQENRILTEINREKLLALLKL